MLLYSLGNREDYRLEYLIEYDKYIKGILKEIPFLISETKLGDILEKSGERDLVTEVDKKVEKYITDKILEKFPDHEVLGEETYDINKKYDDENLWIIDPIDGTTNFIKQSYDYCTIISYFEKGKPQLAYIYDIQKGDLYHCIRGNGVYLNKDKLKKPENKGLKESLISTDIRRMYRERNDLFDRIVEKSFGTRSVGTSGLDGARVLTGKFGGYLNYTGGIWDYAQFILMAEELDLVLMNLEGEKLGIDGYTGYILSTKKVFEELIEAYV